MVGEGERYRDLREGRVHAHVTTARPLADEQKAEIASKLGKALGKIVVVHDRVEPRLLGGLIVKLGDKVIDGSAKRRLDKLRRALASARE